MASKGIRIATRLLTSKLLLAAAFIVLVLLCKVLLDQHTDASASKGEQVSGMVAVLYTEEKPGSEDAARPDFVLLAGLDRLRRDKPNASFLIWPGEGEIDNPNTEFRVRYRVDSLAPGRVLVETRMFHAVPPGNIEVLGRYKATAHEVEPLYSRTGSGMWLVFGLPIAALVTAILYQVGKDLEKRAKPREFLGRSC